MVALVQLAHPLEQPVQIPLSSKNPCWQRHLWEGRTKTLLVAATHRMQMELVRTVWQLEQKGSALQLDWTQAPLLFSANPGRQLQTWFPRASIPRILLSLGLQVEQRVGRREH